MNLPLNFIDGYLLLEGAIFNYGNAYSSASSPDEVSLVFKIIIYVLTVLGIFSSVFALMTREKTDGFNEVWFFVLMLSGCLGNTLDRLVFGNVCDWITITRPESSFYIVTNFADLYIWIGVLGLPFVTEDTFKLKLSWFGVYSLLLFWPVRNVFLH